MLRAYAFALLMLAIPLVGAFDHVINVDQYPHVGEIDLDLKVGKVNWECNSAYPFTGGHYCYGLTPPKCRLTSGGEPICSKPSWGEGYEPMLLDGVVYTIDPYTKYIKVSVVPNILDVLMYVMFCWFLCAYILFSVARCGDP